MIRLRKIKKLLFSALLLATLALSSAPVHAVQKCGKSPGTVVEIGFNIGCNQTFENAILDMTFAILRFLSIGVGLVVIVFIIIAGIQYSTTQGNPQAAMEAVKKIRSALTALLIYVFMFAILQWLVPGGLFP